MDNVKISELPELTVPADADEIAIVDKDVVTTKKITRANLYSDATNSAKGLATAAQITELEANTTHRTSNGSDHTYISQNVSSGASPTLDGMNITNIDADTLIADVKEANVSAVKKGQPCAIVDSSGSKFEVQLADCDDAGLIRLLGIAEVNTDQDGEGTVIHKGLLTNVNTQTSNTDLNPSAETWAAGEMLYVSQTPGGLTKTRPTSGRCIKACRSLKGNSASDTLLAIVHTNSICACAAAGEDVCSRMGDSAGVNKHSFKNYVNVEKAAFDSYGNLTLSGTVDGIDIATDVAANTAKATNVTTNLSEGTSTTTTVNVNSSDGTNATLVAASTTRAGVLTKAKFDEIVVNTAKTGVTGEISNVVEDTTPQLGGTLEINEKAILIDAALSTDHTWTGPTQLITAGENLAIFETAYLKSDGKYWKTNATAEATANSKVVMATAAISADAAGIALLPSDLSFIRDDSTTEWTFTTIGKPIFLSKTAGDLTNDISSYTTGNIGRVAGYMEIATILHFNVDKTWIEI